MYDYLLTRTLCSVLKAIRQRKEESGGGGRKGRQGRSAVLFHWEIYSRNRKVNVKRNK